MDIVHDGPTLVLSGDFDVRSTMEVRTAIHERLDGYDQDVVVDLTDVDTLDLTAARVLAYATLEAGRAGHHLRAARLRARRTPDAPPLAPDPVRRGRAGRRQRLSFVHTRDLRPVALRSVGESVPVRHSPHGEA